MAFLLKHRFKLLLILAMYFLFIHSPLKGQNIFGPIDEPQYPIRSNVVQNLTINGDTVWIGPVMNYNIGHGIDWNIPEGADSVIVSDGRMFSLTAKGQKIMAGIARSRVENGSSVPVAMGFYLSEDGANSWEFIPHPSESEEDTLFYIGEEEYTKLPVIVEEQSPAYEVDFKGDVLFSANWAMGALRSMDNGQSWERIILPPNNISVLDPDATSRYDFYNASNSAQPSVQRDYDPRTNNSLYYNYLGYAVFIDSQDRVWIGTAGGFNISENALTAPLNRIKWTHYSVSLNPNTLLGDWIVTIKENPSNHDIWMTNWISTNGNQEGLVSVSRDLSDFKTHLIGKRIYDFAISGDTLVAAADDGLFISVDYGKSWLQESDIRTPNAILKPDAQFNAVDISTDGVWYIGTNDGLLRSSNLSDWEILRVNYPLKGGNIYSDEGETDTYAAPNPFSPNVHQFVRIKFDVQGSSSAELKIFDTSMNLVNSFSADNLSDGAHEMVWDGTNGNGVTVSNGVYFYTVETGSKTVKGKLLVIK